jgi:hypothetical protein
MEIYFEKNWKKMKKEKRNIVLFNQIFINKDFFFNLK